MKLLLFIRTFSLAFIVALSVLIKPSFALKYAAFVMDAQTGRVLHAENSHRRVHPASLTKVATLYMLFEAMNQGRVKIDTRLKISPHAARQIPSKLALPAGSTITVRDAILALITKSANDIAVAVAEHLSGSETLFAHQMTQKVRRLGLKHTTFKNASGVPNKQQITTAIDMAKLLQVLIRDYPIQYKRYFGQKSFTYKGVIHVNHNRLLGKIDGLDGGKTGFICASGFNISTSAIRHGKRLIAVVMGGETPGLRDQRVTFLLNRGFDIIRKHKIDADVTAQEDLHDLPNPRIAPEFSGYEQTLEKDSLHPQRFTQTRFVSYPQSMRNKGVSPESRKGQKNESKSYQLKQITLSNQGEWGVQIGSYRNANEAHMAAAHLLAKLPTGMDGRVSITRAPRKQGHPYRARLVGFSQEAAQRVCHIIEQGGIPCLPFQGHRQEKMYTAMNTR